MSFLQLLDESSWTEMQLVLAFVNRHVRLSQCAVEHTVPLIAYVSLERNSRLSIASHFGKWVKCDRVLTVGHVEYKV